jgi:ornithine cyclodeaminase/alanine dehydrogenase-like protein (mu-crystallin family)
LAAEPAASAAQAVRGADVIVTSARWPGGPPCIEGDWLAAGAFACALDYDASFTRGAAAAFDRRFTDDVGQMDGARAKGSFPGWPAFSELATGRRATAQQRILCCCLGLAVFDVAVGRRALEIARQRNAGRYLP